MNIFERFIKAKCIKILTKQTKLSLELESVYILIVQSLFAYEVLYGFYTMFAYATLTMISQYELSWYFTTVSMIIK